MTETPRPDHAMSDQTPTDPWNDIYEGIAFNYEDDKLITAIELARAAEREQHQREIAQRDETIRQLRARERELESAVDSAQALARAFAAPEARCATLTTTLEEARQHLAAIGWSMSGGTNLRDRIDAALAAAPQGRETPDPQKGELTDVEM